MSDNFLSTLADIKINLSRIKLKLKEQFEKRKHLFT